MDSAATSRLAANVRAEVARRRIKQADIATALGTTQRAISRRLLGEVPFSATELADLARLLDVDLEQLLGDDDLADAAAS